MLYKKELLSLPVLGFPKGFKKKNKEGYEYAINADVIELKKSGTVLFGEIYHVWHNCYDCRFFTDGKKVLVYDDYTERFYEKLLPGYDNYNKSLVFHNDYTVSLVKSYFNIPPYFVSLFDYLNIIIKNRSIENEHKKELRRYADIERYISLTSVFPDNFNKWLDDNAFVNSYIFISNLKNGKRIAYCSTCCFRFTVYQDARSGYPCVCPRCNRTSIYRGNWYDGLLKDSACFCISFINGKDRINRWYKVKRVTHPYARLPSATHYPTYTFDDLFLNVDITDGDNIIKSSFKYARICSYSGWVRYPDGSVFDNCNPDTAVPVYEYDISAIKEFENIDVSRINFNTDDIGINTLISNFKQYPCTEYFYKLGLTSLAASNLMSRNHSSLSGFCIDKQDLPVYKEFNVTEFEHAVISSFGGNVNRDSFVKFRYLLSRTYYHNILDNFFSFFEVYRNKTNFNKFCNYFYNQYCFNRSYDLNKLLLLYKDYIQMSKILGVDISRKQLQYPKYLKFAHDNVLAKLNENKEQLNKEHYIKIKAVFYNGISKFCNDDYLIVFPESKADFVKESQALSHCLSRLDYFESHIKKEKLIFFIRKASDPIKPFVTMQVDALRLKILQIYGFGNSSVPPDVREFADAFVDTMKYNCITTNRAA